jgi:cysteine synthase B
MAPKPGVRIFAKLEGQNPSGSVKDRIALAMVERAEQQGLLHPGDTIVEASSATPPSPWP